MKVMNLYPPTFKFHIYLQDLNHWKKLIIVRKIRDWINFKKSRKRIGHKGDKTNRRVNR